MAIQRNIESSVMLTMQRNILHCPSLSFCSCKRQKPCLVLYIETTKRKQRLYISYIRVRQSGIFICKNCMQNTRKLRVKPICDQSMHASLCTMYTCYLLALRCALCSVKCVLSPVKGTLSRSVLYIESMENYSFHQ